MDILVQQDIQQTFMKVYKNNKRMQFVAREKWTRSFLLSSAQPDSLLMNLRPFFFIPVKWKLWQTLTFLIWLLLMNAFSSVFHF